MWCIASNEPALKICTTTAAYEIANGLLLILSFGMALLLIVSVFAGVAFELLSQAARMGHAGGMIGLAQLYESGVQTPDLTIEPNQTMAVEL